MYDNGHVPVLLDSVIENLDPFSKGVYLDGTFGGGGYSFAVLKHTDCIVHALDRDPQAKIRSEALKKDFPDRFFFHQGSFSDLSDLFEENMFDGIMFDFGVSSYQLDTAERGFSFRYDGPLDMRMDPLNTTLTAKEVVNTFSEIDLAHIIYTYGEEKRSRQVAREIVTKRKEKPFETTLELAQCVRSVVKRFDGIDPATLTFQALRIFVNNELIEIEEAIYASTKLLKPKGRLITVTFHSLEDRLCKHFIKNHNEKLCLQNIFFHSLTKKPIAPTPLECQQNPRCRSAKLRAAYIEKVSP